MNCLTEEAAASQQVHQSEDDPFAGFPPVRTFRLPQTAKIIILLALAAGGIVYLIMKFVGDAGPQSTPVRAVEGFMKAAQNKDADKMFKFVLIEPSDLPDGQDKESLIEGQRKSFEQNEVNINDYKIEEVEETGNKAKVSVSIELMIQEEKQTGQHDYNLTKIDGKWFIKMN